MPALLKNSTTVSWEQLLDHHEYQSIRAVSTKDFSFFTNLIAQRFHSGENHKATLRSLMGGEDQVGDALRQLNVDKCQTSQDAVDQYKAAVDANKDKNLKKEDWEAQLDEQEEKAVTLVREKIHKATATAKSTIEALPEEAREPAANVYLEGSNLAMQVFNTLSDQIGQLIGKVVDFLKGIFTSVTKAWNTVVDAAHSAISAIKGLFSYTSHGGDGTGANVVYKYVGKLNWPATVAFATATAGLTAVTTYLTNKGATIESQTVETHMGDKKFISTTTTFKLGAPKLPHASGVDPAEVLWLAAVNELDNDSHFIPPVVKNGVS